MKQRKPKPLTNLTPSQLATYSSEWRELFAELMQRGWEVRYHEGRLIFRKDGFKLRAALKNGLWHIEVPNLLPSKKVCDCKEAIAGISFARITYDVERQMGGRWPA